MAQENRDMRMSEAEKKAAGLPPKLTVPMILFFLPVLFVVILGPAVIKVMAIQVAVSAAGAGLRRRRASLCGFLAFGAGRRASASSSFCCASIWRR